MTKKYILSNGATVLVDPMQDVRSLALGFFVRAGSENEPPEKRGLTHFLEHVLFKRTRRRSNVEIARQIDRLGGDVDAFTTREYTGFYAHTLDSRFDDALDLLGDVVLSPAFDAPDIEVERGVILEEIGEANDNPEDLVHEMFVQSFWRSHPLGAPILGTVETVQSITLADLYRYYRERYNPSNLIVSVAGHVRADDVASAVERIFRRRSARPGPVDVSAGRPRGHQHVVLTPRTALEQVHVCFGVAAPSQGSDRRFATNLLDIVLGGGMSSRLFQQVREKRGLAYSIASSLNSYRLGGYETISAACAPKNLARLIDVTLRELGRLKRDGVRERELAWAKENLEGNLMLSLESTVSRASQQARHEFYFGRSIPAEETIAGVERVTVDAVGEEARRLLNGRSLSLSVVGNLSRPPISATDLGTAL